MAMTFTYSGSEALEMLKTHFPKTWEQEINDGRSFIKSLMRMYNLDNMQAYQKYLKMCGSCDKAIATLAALHVMNEQVKIGREIKTHQENQMQYANQSKALEESKATSYQDKRILRAHYLSKQDELQQRVEKLIESYPVIGAKKVIVQTNIFDN